MKKTLNYVKKKQRVDTSELEQDKICELVFNEPKRQKLIINIDSLSSEKDNVEKLNCINDAEVDCKNLDQVIENECMLFEKWKLRHKERVAKLPHLFS